jgi:hypothetical protein
MSDVLRNQQHCEASPPATLGSRTLLTGSIQLEDTGSAGGLSVDFGSRALHTHEEETLQDEVGSRSVEFLSSRSASRFEDNGSGRTGESFTRVPPNASPNADKSGGVRKGCLYRTVARFPRFHNLVLNWPRTFSLIVGVILPLFLLIFIAVVVGIILAKVEAPLEVTANDRVISNDIQTYDGLLLLSAPLFSEQSKFLPSVCLDLYLRQQNASLIEKYILEVMQSESNTLEALNLTDPLDLNGTSVDVFMKECGEFARPIMKSIEEDNTTFYAVIGNALRFNWIRCIPGAKGLNTVAGMASLGMIPYMRYEAQKEYFIQVWREDQKRLYQYYYDESLALNMSSANASIFALQESVKEASGVDGCELNAPASGTSLNSNAYSSSVLFVSLITLVKPRSGWWFFTILTVSITQD